jgi:hypothetical protein
MKSKISFWTAYMHASFYLIFSSFALLGILKGYELFIKYDEKCLIGVFFFLIMSIPYTFYIKEKLIIEHQKRRKIIEDLIIKVRLEEKEILEKGSTYIA